jgi:hypothetical protein
VRLGQSLVQFYRPLCGGFRFLVDIQRIAVRGRIKRCVKREATYLSAED